MIHTQDRATVAAKPGNIHTHTHRADKVNDSRNPQCKYSAMVLLSALRRRHDRRPGQLNACCCLKRYMVHAKAVAYQLIASLELSIEATATDKGGEGVHIGCNSRRYLHMTCT